MRSAYLTRLRLATLAVALLAACSPGDFVLPSPTPSGFSVLAALVKGQDGNLPVVAAVRGPVDAGRRDKFLTAVHVAALQVYPSVIALGGDKVEAERQALKILAAGIGNDRISGATVTLDSDPLQDRDGIHTDFGASLAYGQATMIKVVVGGDTASSGVVLPKLATVLAPKATASMPLNADLLVSWLPQPVNQAYQVELAASGPGASGKATYSSGFLAGGTSSFQIPQGRLPGPGAATITVHSYGGLTADDLQAGRSSFTGAGGFAVGLAVAEQVVMLEPADEAER